LGFQGFGFFESCHTDTIAIPGSGARVLTHFGEWLPKELNMDDPKTGKWYVIADEQTRWGSFLPEKLGHLDCEIKPGTAIYFWHKVRAVTGEQS
jgi:hypothetical protein